MTAAVAVATVATAGVFRPVRFLCIPALVDSLLHDGPVVVKDAAHKKHFHIVLDGY